MLGHYDSIQQPVWKWNVLWFRLTSQSVHECVCVGELLRRCGLDPAPGSAHFTLVSKAHHSFHLVFIPLFYMSKKCFPKQRYFTEKNIFHSLIPPCLPTPGWCMFIWYPEFKVVMLFNSQEYVFSSEQYEGTTEGKLHIWTQKDKQIMSLICMFSLSGLLVHVWCQTHYES